MPQIRVDPQRLELVARELQTSSQGVDQAGAHVALEAFNAPNYDHQFNARLRPIGHEARERAAQLAARLAALNTALMRTAEAFVEADLWASHGLTALGQFEPRRLLGLDELTIRVPLGPWQVENPLLMHDPEALFEPPYMSAMIGANYTGSGLALGNTMETLLENPEGPALDEALQDLAHLRNRPLQEIQAEYEHYLEVQAQRDANSHATPSDVSFVHPFFMGSTSQLRYGQVVGDAFGIDPVFGALLNPTGGLVGPSNFAIDVGNNAVGYHGVFHDAAGYLYNNHGVGPGYDYLGLEGRDSGSPLTGQYAGIAYWRRKLFSLDPFSLQAEGAMHTMSEGLDFSAWLMGKTNAQD